MLRDLLTIQYTRILFIVMVSMLSKLQEINLLRCIKPHNITIYNITTSSQGIHTIVIPRYPDGIRNLLSVHGFLHSDSAGYEH
jgi:hypothetical protein